MPKKTVVRKCVVDPTEDLDKKRVLESRRQKIRQFLQVQSVQTGRSFADLISQALTKDEVAEALQLVLRRVTPDGETGAVLPSPPPGTDVKDEPQDGIGSPKPVRIK